MYSEGMYSSYYWEPKATFASVGVEAEDGALCALLLLLHSVLITKPRGTQGRCTHPQAWAPRAGRENCAMPGHPACTLHNSWVFYKNSECLVCISHVHLYLTAAGGLELRKNFEPENLQYSPRVTMKSDPYISCWNFHWDNDKEIILCD